MNKERFIERKADFIKALSRLKEALAEKETSIARDAAIQRFEFCYELAWNTMKLWLESKDIDVRNAKDTLREALKQGLIEDGSGWSLMHENRNLTSHTYDEQTAVKVHGFIKKEGVALFDVLEARLEAAAKDL
ncbi:MAG: nucleotidyltransferase substrate binding protein [Nitrospinae bacterium]|nr:nucleotidyltransferase substrate binding protein [Nitrospinota bacterium]